MQAGPSFVFADTFRVTPSLSSFQEQPVLPHLSLNALAGVASLAGPPKARAQELDSRFESCLCSKQLCGFAQVTSALGASVSSSVKWSRLHSLSLSVAARTERVGGVRPCA